jgi:pyridoxine 5-phosphate synthase
MSQHLRLGVNIDHVATIRNARGGVHPDPVRAAHLAVRAGADGITAHLREDRRHISDDDIERLVSGVPAPINLEMAPTEEMLALALRHRPHAVCIVPERREERTTEGGIDAVAHYDRLAPIVRRLVEADIAVALFVEARPLQVKAAHMLGARAVELHTGAYCAADGENKRRVELKHIVDAADLAVSLGLDCHAGHGLSYETVGPIAAIHPIVELNIGHFLIGEAIFTGLEVSIARMRAVMDAWRMPTSASPLDAPPADPSPPDPAPADPAPMAAPEPSAS